jgi:hypothetical protein
MLIHTTEPLFAWGQLKDHPTLATIRDFLDTVPDQSLLDGLHAASGGGCGPGTFRAILLPSIRPDSVHWPTQGRASRRALPVHPRPGVSRGTSLGDALTPLLSNLNKTRPHPSRGSQFFLKPGPGRKGSFCPAGSWPALQRTHEPRIRRARRNGFRRRFTALPFSAPDLPARESHPESAVPVQRKMSTRAGTNTTPLLPQAAVRTRSRSTPGTAISSGQGARRRQPRCPETPPGLPGRAPQASRQRPLLMSPAARVLRRRRGDARN